MSASSTIHLVRECWHNGNGQTEAGFAERDDNQTGLEATICDLICGQIEHPLQVIAIDVSEGWAIDVSEDVAITIAHRLMHIEIDWSEAQGLLNFIQAHAGVEIANELERAA